MNINLSFPKSRESLYNALQEYVSEQLGERGSGVGRGERSRSSVVIQLIEEALIRRQSLMLFGPSLPLDDDGYGDRQVPKVVPSGTRDIKPLRYPTRSARDEG